METQEEKAPKRTITDNVYPTVAKMKLSDISDYPGNSKCSHVIISNGVVVNSVSGTYGLLKNEDFFKVVEDKLKEEHINFEAKYKAINNSHFAVDYILDGEVEIKGNNARVAGGDKIQPKIRLINSYDGSSPTLGFLGFYRKVCENGLHALKYEVDFRFKHREGNLKKAMPSLHQMIEKYKETEGIKLISRFEVLAEQQVKTTDLEAVVKNIADSTKLFKFEKSDENISPSKNAQFVLDKIAFEADHFKTVPNKWLVYNAFNEWLNNDERNSKLENHRVDLDAKLFATVESLG